MWRGTKAWAGCDAPLMPVRRPWSPRSPREQVRRAAWRPVLRSDGPGEVRRSVHRGRPSVRVVDRFEAGRVGRRPLLQPDGVGNFGQLLRPPHVRPGVRPVPARAGGGLAAPRTGRQPRSQAHRGQSSSADPPCCAEHPPIPIPGVWTSGLRTVIIAGSMVRASRGHRQEVSQALQRKIEPGDPVGGGSAQDVPRRCGNYPRAAGVPPAPPCRRWNRPGRVAPGGADGPADPCCREADRLASRAGLPPRRTRHRQGCVKAVGRVVREASTTGQIRPRMRFSLLVRTDRTSLREFTMADVAFVLVTIAGFVLVALVAKGVTKL